jgi:hypothetical protein
MCLKWGGKLQCINKIYPDYFALIFPLFLGYPQSLRLPRMKFMPFGQAPPQVENDNLETQFLNLNPGFLTPHPKGSM